jgi:hypothetical protein
MLDSLYESKIIVDMEWYKGPLTGCKQPDSNYITRTKYPTYFVVILK